MVTYPTGGYTRYSYTADEVTDLYYEPASDPAQRVYRNLHMAKEKDKCTDVVVPFGAASAPDPSTLACPSGEKKTLYAPVLVPNTTILGVGMTITTPDGTSEKHLFGGLWGGSPSVYPDGSTACCTNNPIEVEIDVIANGQLLRKTKTDLASDNLHPLRKTYTLEDGTVRTEEWDWNESSTGNYPNLANDKGAWDWSEHREYDWGSGAPGSLLRKTDATWGSTAYAGRPGYHAHQKISEAVYQASSTTPASQSTFQYDDYSRLGGISSTGAISHGGISIAGAQYSSVLVI